MTNIQLRELLLAYPDNMPVRIIDCDENGENYRWAHIFTVESSMDVESLAGEKPFDYCSPFISIY